MRKINCYSNILKKGTYFSFIIPSINNIGASEKEYDEKLEKRIKDFIDYYKTGKNNLNSIDYYLDDFQNAPTKDYKDSLTNHRWNLEYLFYNFVYRDSLYPYFLLNDFGIHAKDLTKDFEMVKLLII